MYFEKDKLISLRVNSRKYIMVKAYIDKNKWRSFPALSFGEIFDNALDRFIKENKITEQKPIKNQYKMKL